MQYVNRPYFLQQYAPRQVKVISQTLRNKNNIDRYYRLMEIWHLRNWDNIPI